MDAQLRFKQHIMRVANRGLHAALALKRLHMLSPKVARQLFHSTVAPVIDYASTIWSHARRVQLGLLNRIQKIGAQAVTGAFTTAATAVIEAEASIKPISQRIQDKAIRWWTDLATLPINHPLRSLRLGNTKRFISPLQRIQREMYSFQAANIERIDLYTIPL